MSGSETVPADVTDAHAKTQNVIRELQSIPIGALNETESEHAYNVLQRLYDLDDALAVRSEFGPADRPSEFLGTDDEQGGA